MTFLKWTMNGKSKFMTEQKIMNQVLSVAEKLDPGQDLKMFKINLMDELQDGPYPGDCGWEFYGFDPQGICVEWIPTAEDEPTQIKEGPAVEEGENVFSCQMIIIVKNFSLLYVSFFGVERL